VVLHNPDSSIASARLFLNIGALGWCAFGGFFLWFMLAFTGDTVILKKKWFYLLILGVPLVLIYKQWTNFIIVDLVKEWYGWRGIIGRTFWPYFLYLYYLTVMGIGLFLNVKLIRRTHLSVLKKQAKIVFVSVLISLALGTFTDVICTVFSLRWVPDIADVCALIWAVGAAYAIGRYQFLTVTPITAADNIISTMFECLILLNLEGVIANVNQTTVDLSGYDEVELEGKPLSLLFGQPGDGIEPIGEIPLNEIMAEGLVKNRELVLKTRMGKEIPVLFSSSLLLDDVGTVAGIVCVAKDISEHKALEREHLQSKKIESVGLLAHSVAHDFKNLLAQIIGALELARQEVPCGDTAYKHLVNAEEVSKKALELAVKFNIFSHGGTLEKERIIIPQLLQKMQPPCLNDFSGDPGSSFYYEIESGEGLVPVYGDESQLLQVLEQMFCNALESIPAGREGRIWVRAENETVEVDIKEGNRFLLEKGQYVKLSMRDNGSGIKFENMEKVFDPYFSTKQKTSRKGVGLGLTICYSIIKKHGGHITVESEPGKGTTVSLYLPAAT